MNKKKNILLLYKGSSSIPDQIVESAKAKVPKEFTLLICDKQVSDSDRRKRISEADYIIAYSTPIVDYDLLGRVKLVQLLSAGYDYLDLDKLSELQIPVANNGSVNSSSVAEHAVLLMLSVLKMLPEHHISLQKGEWLEHKHALQLRDIRGKQIGILGFGHIGRSLAVKLSSFEVKLAYFDLTEAPKGVVHGFNIKRMGFDELIATSDIISVHMPLTDVTRGIISEEKLKSMKKSAIIINTSRGAVIDEKALIQALDGGMIGGAGLDVFESEPLGADSQLLNRSNVVLTPHIAGTSVDNWTWRFDYAFENILRIDAGKEPLARIV